MGTIIVSIFLLSTLLAPASGISPGPIANTNRRCLLKSIASAVPLSIQSVAFPRSANAAGPLATYETDSIAAVLQRKYLLPKPTRLLRPKLNMEFAVLLMRSSYSVLDDLDCVPMDQFQRDFFLIRQAEYQPYVDALGGGLGQFLKETSLIQIILILSLLPSMRQYLAMLTPSLCQSCSRSNNQHLLRKMMKLEARRDVLLMLCFDAPLNF
mmetsp:Transcript_12350/g.27040  ORF Transcript_12350/g.27040 Transcript_12350/m.27040 type:complete len:211 (-) Transcript_12350:668-1300(-)